MAAIAFETVLADMDMYLVDMWVRDIAMAHILQAMRVGSSCMSVVGDVLWG